MQIGRGDLEKIYEWRQTHVRNMGSACFTLAGAILSPLLAAVFDASTNVETWAVCAYIFGASLAAGAGVAWHRHTRYLEDAYATHVAVVPGEDAPPDLVDW